MEDLSDEQVGSSERRVRADAQRNTDALLEAATAIFRTSGVDAPVREIAQKAGVGVGTVYRHFPQRSDLIAAVFRYQIDACVAAAGVMAKKYDPMEALSRWLYRYTDFLVAKRGLATALYSGNPAYESLPGYFLGRLKPALTNLLEAAESAGAIRSGVDPEDLLHMVGSLCMSRYEDGNERARRMLVLLIDGLRFGASPSMSGGWMGDD